MGEQWKYRCQLGGIIVIQVRGDKGLGQGVVVEWREVFIIQGDWNEYFRVVVQISFKGVVCVGVEEFLNGFSFYLESYYFYVVWVL